MTRRSLKNARVQSSHKAFFWAEVRMQRRKFIAFLSGAAVAWPVIARAQHTYRSMRRVGVLMGFGATDPEAQSFRLAFSRRLKELGWIDGTNIAFEDRWAAGDLERFEVYAAELVSLDPDVILANTTPAVKALARQTATIPIVFVQVTDPFGQGIVTNLAHPGANITGFSFVDFTVAGKCLEELKEIAPAVIRVAVIYNPHTMPLSPYLSSLQAAATSLAIDMIASPVHDGRDIERAITAISEAPGGGLCVIGDPFATEHRSQIIELAARNRVPAIYARRIFVANGGLISYGTDVVALFKNASDYVDRILRGEKPGDLPVQTPTGYELVINLKAAKALGLTVPPILLSRADEVIE
jgi:putative ABC transport system substrate-binding protein